MPKLKTHKGVARRFRITAGGKLLRLKSGRRHLLTRKPARKMRHLRRQTEASWSLRKTLRQLLPYG